MSKELDELEEIARLATRKALEDYEPMPDEWAKNLVLTTIFEGDDRVFVLYVPGERRDDAIVISSARVDGTSRSVDVSVTNLRKRSVT
ncbi:hypothetical protein [Longimicrobium sp.]|uniref:hypothetical protein n=1 Tax=Longimicrobium sp. TaxID=2029185 RepID=UPI003B3B35D4